MVSNYWTKRTLWILLVLSSLFNFNVQSQKLDKYYVSKYQEDNTLYFLMSVKGFEVNKLDRELEYDITYQSNSSSVIFNFTYLCRDEIEIKALTIKLENQDLLVEVKKNYIGYTRKGWKYRYTSTLLFQDLIEFYDQEKPPTISLKTKVGIHDLYMSPRKWKQHKQVQNKILKLIQNNKK